jgi:6-phosphogluconolactonase (cycloisomerase 2 family)
MRKNIYQALSLFIIFLSYNTRLTSLIVGSLSTPSSHSNIIFPTADNNNTILGFSKLEEGFSLEDNTTSCTFDGFISLSGNVGLSGGSLYLEQDFILSHTSIISQAGKIYGQNHSVQLPHSSHDYYLPNPLDRSFGLKFIDAESMFSTVRSIDWSFDDQYIAAGSQRSNSNQELKIYYFDGAVLTTTTSIELGRDAYSIAWHPTKRFIAVGRRSSSGHELYIFKHNVHNGTVVLTDSIEGSGESFCAVAWRPDGNSLVVGRTSGGTNEIIAYSFNDTTGALTEVDTADLSPNRHVYYNALSFSSDGNHFVVATKRNTDSGGDEIAVYNFDGTTITFSTGVNTNIDMQGVAWSPMSNYIAVGFENDTSTRLRIYEYDPSGETLTQVTSGNVSENNEIQHLAWDSTGTYLSVSIDNGTSSRLDVYYFDSTAVTLTKVQSLPSTTSIYVSRWSHDDTYIAWGDRNRVVNVAGRALSDLLIDNATVVLNANTFLRTACFLQGSCRINGQGKQLTLDDNNGLYMRPGSHVTFENLDIYNIRNNQFLCLSDDCSLTLRNCTLHLSSDYTFSQGSITFDEDCILSGSSHFIYSPSHSSTINSNAMLSLASGITFSYAPIIPNKTLLHFNDNTAILFCEDGSTLHATHTGLSITQGSIMLDGLITFSSEGRNSGEALRLSSNVDIYNLSNSILNLHGNIVYE